LPGHEVVGRAAALGFARRSAPNGRVATMNCRRSGSMRRSSSPPVGALVPAALRAVEKGGVVICGGIHMSDIPSFPYERLWGERTIRPIANLTRGDVEEFLAIAPRAGVRTHTGAMRSPRRMQRSPLFGRGA
jgi:D-arabinose 1-dehydrogenase-like Zn-dependent alcohol dehydrogenase